MQKDRLQLEKTLWGEGFKRVMGLDEVGRGCLAGPVVAAGVILDPNEKIEGIRDSKTIPEAERQSLAEEIKAKVKFWTIQTASPQEIDQLNILWASIRTMVLCSEAEGASPDYLLVDGNRFSSSLVPYQCVVKGDDKSESIGAASILAKVFRDELMKKLHNEYPYFGWDSNVGYPTKVHFQGLQQYGITSHHRRTFNLRTQKVFLDK
jgi:ribonuclease HII